jgi:hypothetical protein
VDVGVQGSLYEPGRSTCEEIPAAAGRLEEAAGVWDRVPGTTHAEEQGGSGVQCRGGSGPCLVCFQSV